MKKIVITKKGTTSPKLVLTRKPPKPLRRISPKRIA